jgi:hypothetical protein
MRRVFAIVAAGAAAAAFGLAAPPANADNPVAPVDGGTVAQQCYGQGSSSIDDPGYKFCRSVANVETMAAAACRMPLRSAPDASLPDYCGVFDGREVSEARVAAYERSWVHRALTLQRGLDASAPLWEEQLAHTHNTFNASAYTLPNGAAAPSYYPTLTNQDPNQVYSMTDQMRMDIRAIEIDLHWVPSPYGNPSTHGYWVTICHGDGEDPTGQGAYAHVGCTDDRPAQDGLAEVRRWLDANPGEFLLVYLENQLFPAGPVATQQQAHDVAAQIIRDQLGSLVYQPPAGLASGTCAPMPYDESRAHLLAMGKRVLLVGNCGPGAWNQWVFTRGPKWDESGNPTSYSASDCARDMAARESHSSFRRWYEESPWLEAMTNATQVLTATTTAAMVRCGANIIGFDQLQPFDGRLAALVWSWAQGQPAAAGGACAYQGSDSRFRTGDCGAPHRFACVDAHLDWHVTAARGPWWGGFVACPAQFAGSSYGVPPNGYRNAQLANAATDGGGVWLDYRRVNGTWVADAPAPSPLVTRPHDQRNNPHRRHRHVAGDATTTRPAPSPAALSTRPVAAAVPRTPRHVAGWIGALALLAGPVALRRRRRRSRALR